MNAAGLAPAFTLLPLQPRHPRTPCRPRARSRRKPAQPAEPRHMWRFRAPHPREPGIRCRRPVMSRDRVLDAHAHLLHRMGRSRGHSKPFRSSQRSNAARMCASASAVPSRRHQVLPDFIAPTPELCEAHRGCLMACRAKRNEPSERLRGSARVVGPPFERFQRPGRAADVAPEPRASVNVAAESVPVGRHHGRAHVREPTGTQEEIDEEAGTKGPVLAGNTFGKGLEGSQRHRQRGGVRHLPESFLGGPTRPAAFGLLLLRKRDL
jgi:hypothetical protein